MKNNTLAKNVKALRTKAALSQEQLAEDAKLSLRTIQRIENGESEARGETLRQLAIALGVSPDELIEWTAQEDNGYLAVLNLSALSFIAFPLLGILLPLILWLLKKDKVSGAHEVGKSVLNFQITWTIIFFTSYIGLVVSKILNAFDSGDVNAGYAGSTNGDISPSMLGNALTLGFALVLSFYALNIILTVVNAIRAYKGKSVKYFPVFRFIR